MPGTSPSPSSIGELYIGYCRRRLRGEYLPRIERCVSELGGDDLWWRPDESGNSVGNLILHLSGNVEQWINAGLGGAPDHRNRPGEFSARGRIPGEELLAMLKDVVERADETLAGFDPARLTEKRTIQIYEVTCLDALSHVVEHFAQHLGQIIYITKLRRGIDLKFYDL